MDVLGSTGQVELNLSRTQLDEERQTRALASGLRVSSAVDDPSGLAISENLQTQVLGLQQGVQNVQTANNLLAVADSALSVVEGILTRIHSLIVEAHSSFNSIGQLNSIQAEITTLLQEVNKIAGDAKFNGISLFDGHLSPYTPYPTQSSITEVNAEPNANGTISSTNVTNADGLGNPGALIQTNGAGPLTSVPSLIEFRVVSYDAATASDVLQLTAYSLTGSSFGQAPEMQDIAEVPVGSGVISGISTPTPSGGGVLLQNYSLANLTQADVGVAMAFLVTNPAFGSPAPPSGQALQVNSGGNEGQTVSIALPQIDIAALGLSGINVLPNNVIDFNNNVTGNTGSDNTYAADYAEAQVQGAIDAVNQVRAKLGAQTVALQEDANDASVQIVNQTASESAIRDVNIGQAATQFTQDQIMTNIGTSVLAQMHANAQLIIQLVNGMNPGISGRV